MPTRSLNDHNLAILMSRTIGRDKKYRQERKLGRHSIDFNLGVSYGVVLKVGH